MIDTEKALEFDKVKELLADFACTDAAKEKCRMLGPSLRETEVAAALRETSEGRLMIEKCGNPPVTALQGVQKSMETAKKGGCLIPEELEQIGMVLASIKRMKDYLNRGKHLLIGLPYYEENLDSLESVREEIAQKIRVSRVDDYASKKLKEVREAAVRLEEQMREKADRIIRTEKTCMSDSFSTIRNGHICVPVKKECRSKIGGTIFDKSSTGNTLFMEPLAVARDYEELQMKRLEEENEERRILYGLTALLADKEEVMNQNVRTMEKLDFLFAKGRLSILYDGVCPSIHAERSIHITKGRHPLMDMRENVPLDFSLGDGVRGIIITGPNTGGKTVAMKTVALNCLMAQCGLHVAAGEADICLNDGIYCDMGDGQNLSENLSTFSAHITNVLEILQKTNRESLVVMDELGSGTDPTEGMGIAVAILEELRRSGALFVVTTHYPEVKQYAAKTEGVMNARMTFDRETLRPLYHLVLGEAGESCAFYIAERLGMPKRMLSEAAKAAYGENTANCWENPVEETEPSKERAGHVQKKKKTKGNVSLKEKYRRGDSVMVFPDRKIGIVCESADEKGILRVQLPDKKIYINHKRVKLLVAAAELYPEDYDFSIIFDTVENRKLRHDMERKYVKDGTIRYEEN